MNLVYCDRPSASAKALADALGVKRWKSRVCDYGDVVINWGCSSIPNQLGRAALINFNAGCATNKLETFNLLSQQDELEEYIPYYTKSYQEALENISGKCVGRTKLSGHSGEGIVIVDDVTMLDGRDDIKLYLPYMKKKHEFRVHVINTPYGVYTDVQQKKRKRGAEHLDNQIRNYSNGWIYSRNDIQLDVENLSTLIEIAKVAVSALSLSFGAVDIIYNERYNKFTILEINSAPGLKGSTLDFYSSAMMNYFF